MEQKFQKTDVQFKKKNRKNKMFFRFFCSVRHAERSEASHNV